MTYRNWVVGALSTASVLLASAAAYADGIHVLNPVDGAVVREIVPIRVAKSDLPANGYVSVSIDGQLRSARVLPDSGDTVYLWDTKAPVITSNTDASAVPTYVADGAHVINVNIYQNVPDKPGILVGSQTINVELANKITTIPPNGVTMRYKFALYNKYHYSRNSLLNETVGNEDPSVTHAKFLFDRTVEDVSGGDAFLRDQVLPKGFIQHDGATQTITAAYNLKSKFRTYTTEGRQVDEFKPLTPGTHLGFSIPALPERRVSIGDSWQAPVSVSMKWTGNDPATFTAEARLEDFEWQDRYPCARIRETYTGPMTFTVSKDTSSLGASSPYSGGGYPGGGYPGGGYPGASGGGSAGPAASMMAEYAQMSSGRGSEMPGAAAGATPAGPVTSVTIPEAKFERIIYFAYGSGRLIKTTTSITVDSMTSQDVASLALDSGLPTPTASFGSSSANYPGYAGGASGRPSDAGAEEKMMQQYRQATSQGSGGGSSGPPGGSSAADYAAQMEKMYAGASGSDQYGASGDGSDTSGAPANPEANIGVTTPDTTVKLAYTEDTEIVASKAH